MTWQQQQQPPADQGAAELPTTTEGIQPPTVEEEQPVPVCQEGLEFNEDLGFCVPEDCPEGQVLDEESGICVLEPQLLGLRYLQYIYQYECKYIQ